METVLTGLFVIGVCWFFLLGSYIAAEESTLRKKQWRAGTHDYYGNKLEEE